MKGPVERFAPDPNTAWGGKVARKQARLRARELRILGGKVLEWNHIEGIPIGNNCMLRCRVYYVQVVK